MGTWGHNTFENDDASDWVYELDESSGFSVIEAALDAVTREADAFLEAPDCAIALAAAEVVAALNGHPGVSLPEEVTSWTKNKPRPGPELLAKTLKVITAVMRSGDSSELYALWQESGTLDAWQASVADLQGRLQQDVG